ncbi:DUF616 domain-containing protein [Clostridiales bacterium FE2011]|nr:DUF616 domain-containing protein [Clostridiales bacterium FE2011]
MYSTTQPDEIIKQIENLKKENISTREKQSGLKKLGKLLLHGEFIRAANHSLGYLKWKFRKIFSAVDSFQSEKNLETDTCNYFFPERIAVYTAVFSSYDELQEPKFLPDNCDFYVFSDSVTIPESSAWKTKELPDSVQNEMRFFSPVEKNRYLKMHPDLLFPEYDYSVYVDGNLMLYTDPTEYINRLSKYGISFYTHYRRCCVYEEFRAVSAKHRMTEKQVQEVKRFLLDVGMPAKYGLLECPVIARRHHQPECKKLMAEWWELFRRFPYRDQVLLPYVLYKNGIRTEELGLLGNNVWDASGIRKIEHVNRGPVNWVISFREPYYHTMFSDCLRDGSIQYMPLQRRSFIMLLLRIGTHQKLPPIIRKLFLSAFSCITMKKLENEVRKMDHPELPLCFMLSRRYIAPLRYNLYQKIRRCFPDSSVILYLTDLLCLEDDREEIPHSGKFADLICSFDQNDASRYNLFFHNVPMSNLTVLSEDITPTVDICFVGKGKNRQQKMLELCHYLTARGLKCAVWLTDVPEEEQVKDPSIHYCGWMSYEDYLKKEASSRIILEIVQDRSSGNTLRVNEAIMMGRKLLSDNPALLSNPAYDSRNMMVFEKPEDISDEFLFSAALPYTEEQQQALSPSVFLKEMEMALQCQKS